jgi:hypothetical protein
MSAKQRIAKLEKGKVKQASGFMTFKPPTLAQLEREKAESLALYSKLRRIVTSDELPNILQEADGIGGLLVRRFGSKDADKVRAECVTLLDNLEARYVNE